MVGCNRKTIYSHYEPTPLAGWDRNDTLTFCVAPIPADGLYHEEVGLRTSSAFPFKGLTLVVEQRTLHAFMMRIDTLSAQLMESDGTIQGQGISYFQYSFPLTDVYLNGGDTLMVSVRHVMKREVLPGVSDVGVTVAVQNEK